MPKPEVKIIDDLLWSLTVKETSRCHTLEKAQKNIEIFPGVVRALNYLKKQKYGTVTLANLEWIKRRSSNNTVENRRANRTPPEMLDT